MSPSAKKRKGILGSGEQRSADQSDTPNKPHVTRTNATLLRFYRGGLPSSVEASIFSVFCCGRVFRARPEGSKKDHLKFPQWPDCGQRRILPDFLLNLSVVFQRHAYEKYMQQCGSYTSGSRRFEDYSLPVMPHS
jgi:hypothetical protein